MSIKKALRQAINSSLKSWRVVKVHRIEFDQQTFPNHTMWIEVEVKKVKPKKLCYSKTTKN